MHTEEKIVNIEENIPSNEGEKLTIKETEATYINKEQKNVKVEDKIEDSIHKAQKSDKIEESKNNNINLIKKEIKEIKKEENNNQQLTNNVNNCQQSIKEENKKRNSIQERIKNLENINKNKKEEQPKKIENNDKKHEEKTQKEEKKNEKPLSFAEKLKLMEGKGRMMVGPPAPRRHSAFENKINFNPALVLKKEEKNDNKDKSKKEEEKPISFPNKINMMKQMFENKGGPRMFGAPRPSAQLMGMTKFGNINEKKEENLGVIEEKADVLSKGFDPVNELENKMKNIVVQKNKKKKARPNFEG